MNVTGEGTPVAPSAQSRNATRFTVASWNINAQAGFAVDAHLRFLQAKGCEIVALQEVTEDYFSMLRQHPSVSGIAYSLELRPPAKDAPKKNRIGCAVLSLNESLVIRSATMIETATCPERTLIAEVASARHRFQVASLHSPNGSNWGRAKAVWFHEVANWMQAQTKPTIFGIDANTPKTEGLADSNPHKWWREDSDPAVGNGAQQLVGDTPRHKLRDTWKQLNPDSASFPVSHNRDKGRDQRPQYACRYDFIFLSPHFTANDCTYHYEATVMANPRLSDHALVTATVQL